SSNNKNALSIPIAATIKLLNQWKACRIDNAIRIGNAYSAYNNMIQENIKPDVYTYLSLIIGCASKLDLDLALTTTDNLVMVHLLIDVMCGGLQYSKKLSIKSSTKIDLDLKLNNYEVALMKSQDVCKLPLDNESFNGTIEWLCSYKKPPKTIIKIIKKFHENGVNPTIKNY
ncbi:10985_t:CDS:2, partial [Entrophospora sp. SA101]